MKLRTVIVTVAVLAVLSAIVAFIRRPDAAPAADPRVNQSIVNRALIEKASKLRLSDAGKTVELTRQADGTWRVPSYYDMPADFTKLSGFVSNLTDAKLQRLVTSTPERIARLEFKDTKIALLDESGKELWTITLGKTAESGGRYVRFGDEPKAFLANFSAWLDADPKNWADAALLALKAEDIAKVELTFPQGEPVTLTRAKKDETWTASPIPAGHTINADKVSSTLSSLTSIRFSDTTELNDPNAVAAKANQRTVKLTTFDGKTVQIALGRKPEEKKLKPPSAHADASAGPGALGSVTDLAKSDAASKSGDAATPPKPMTPEFETIPAGPVFVTITQGDPNAPVNALMQKRAFQVSDFAFTSLPQNPAELFTAPPSPPAAQPTGPAHPPSAAQPSAAASTPAEPGPTSAASPTPASEPPAPKS